MRMLVPMCNDQCLSRAIMSSHDLETVRCKTVISRQDVVAQVAGRRSRRSVPTAANCRKFVPSGKNSLILVQLSGSPRL